MRSLFASLAFLAALLLGSPAYAQQRTDQLQSGAAISDSDTFANCQSCGATVDMVKQSYTAVKTWLMSKFAGDFTCIAAGTCTLATVNSTVGTYTNANVTVNAKGQVTSASSGSSTAGGTVTQNGNLVTNNILTGGTNGTSDARSVATGTGVLTALGISAGSPGSYVRNNGDSLSGTFAGTPTFSGQLTFTGVPAGTIAAGNNLGLDATNKLVKSSVAGGATTGFGVDGGTTPQAVTAGATINNTTDEVWINTGWVTGTLVLPPTASVASHKCIRIQDSKNYVDATHTVAIQPDSTDAINGGTNGVATGAYQNQGFFVFACAVQETHNWNLGPGTVLASTAPTNKFANGVDRNGLIYGFVTLAGASDVNITSPSNGQSLIYDTVSSKWLNGTPAGGGNVSAGAALPSGNLVTGAGSTNVQDSGVTLTNVAKLNVAETFTAAQTFGEVHGALNAQTGTTYTVVAADCGGILKISNAGAITLTVPSTITGVCAIAVQQGGAGQITVTAGGGATLASVHSYTKTFGQHAIISLSNSGTARSDWVLSGDGA